jgi:hypothetical protein
MSMSASPRHRIETSVVAAASIDAVWARVADITTWSAWGDWDDTTRDVEGVPTPDGVGTIRRLRRGKRTNVEEVVAFETPAPGPNGECARFAYELRSGLPLRNYHSEITLETVGGGTRLRWVSTFDGENPVAGLVVKVVLGRFLPRTARQLAAAAEADTAR